MLRLALAVLLSVLLAGCILETERPLFKEEDGALALGRKASAYGAWNKVNGTWQEAKTEAGHLTLNPEGRHYRIEIVDAASKDTTQEQMRVLFVPLAQKKFVLQAEADGENPVYAIGELVGRDLLISPRRSREIVHCLPGPRSQRPIARPVVRDSSRVSVS